MIVLDFETNTQNPYDVIEVGAIRVDKNLNVLEIFHRYYISRYRPNQHSIAVHHLTPEKLKLLQKKEHEKFFNNDKDFISFCKGTTSLVAHNITFELRFIGELVKFENHICTMKINRGIIPVYDKNGKLKNPKLKETCEYYKIDFDDTKYHSAIYDVEKTLEILKIMKYKKGN
jgi:DNA polymerase-3 subunit epsilon